MWYAKRVVEGNIVSITTYEQEKPMFSEQEKLEWSEITKEEYDNILQSIQRKVAEENQVEDVEITADEV